MTKRQKAQDKSLINCTDSDVNQLMPMKYKWAWEHYLNENANHWRPTEVAMGKDIELWKSKELSAVDKHIIKRNLGFFATAESLVANNITLAVFKHVTNPECRQYLLRQALTEAIHTETFHYVVESLGLDEGEIFNMYRETEDIYNKDEFCINLTRGLNEGTIDTNTLQGKQDFLKNLIGFYVIMEGLFFYSGFAMILSYHRQNKMIGIGEQFQYILRDETIHLNFGIDLINGIKAENPEAWTEKFQNEIYAMIKEAVKLEAAYAADCLKIPVLGLNADMFDEYVKYIANRRLERIGLKQLYPGAINPFPWLSETIDIQKEKNFFETRVTEYQSSSALSWD